MLHNNLGRIGVDCGSLVCCPVVERGCRDYLLDDDGDRMGQRGTQGWTSGCWFSDGGAIEERWRSRRGGHGAWGCDEVAWFVAVIVGWRWLSAGLGGVRRLFSPVRR